MLVFGGLEEGLGSRCGGGGGCGGYGGPVGGRVSAWEGGWGPMPGVGAIRER